MSILTTSAARSRSYLRGRNAHDHHMASPLPQTQSPGTQSHADEDESDGRTCRPPRTCTNSATTSRWDTTSRAA
jgi:hypothetical protein